MRIRTSELIVVLIVAILVLGPDKLPYYAKKLGSTFSTIKQHTSDLAREINESVSTPLEELKEPIKKSVEPLQEFASELKDPVFKGKL